jgi:hypothetical protein
MVYLHFYIGSLFLLDERVKPDVANIRGIRSAESDFYRFYFFDTYLFIAPFGGKLQVAAQHHPINAGDGAFERKDKKGRG